MTEREVCKSLREYWKKNGFFYIRNQQGLGSKRGTADYTVVKDGKTLWIEAKAEKGKQSPYQLEFQQELERSGGNYAIVRSVEDFKEAWEGRGHERKETNSKDKR